MTVERGPLPPRYRDCVWVAGGGMGDVYRATDTVLARTVAAKVLSERYATDGEVRKRFRREALAAARLSGEPNTVTTFDVGEWEGRPFIVMEYFPGGTLGERLRSGGAQRSEQALGWLQQAGRSLDAAHRLGVVHRDVKPENLLLDGEGRAHVADFGIATAAGLDSLTKTGTILGTAGYLAPEQAHGRPATAATDEYALGVVAFELLTGTRPFAAESPTAEAASHVFAPVPSAAERHRSVPAAADPVFTRALAKEPADRFPSCGAFVEALRLAYDRTAATTRIASAPAAAAVPARRVVDRRRRARLLVPVTVLAFAGGGVAAVLATRDGSGHLAVTSTRPNTSVAATTTARAPITRVTRTTSPVALVDPHTLNNRGYALMLSGDYSRAMPLLERAVVGLRNPSDPVTAYANFNLGQTLVRLGRCGAALPYLRHAAALEPQSTEAQDGLAAAEQCAGVAPSGGSSGPGEPPGRHGRGHGHGHGHDGN